MNAALVDASRTLVRAAASFLAQIGRRLATPRAACPRSSTCEFMLARTVARGCHSPCLPSPSSTYWRKGSSGCFRASRPESARLTRRSRPTAANDA